MNPGIKIDERKIVKYGSMTTLPLPKVFISDNKMIPGAEIEIFRSTTQEGRDALILIPKVQGNFQETGEEVRK